MFGKHEEVPTSEDSDVECPNCLTGYMYRKFSAPAVKKQIKQGDVNIEILSKKVGTLANTKQGESLKVIDDWIMIVLISFVVTYLLTFNLWFAICIGLIVKLVSLALKIADEDLWHF